MLSHARMKLRSATPSLDDLFSRALRRIKQNAALAGALALSVPGAGCAVESLSPEISSEQQADWAQYEGQRRTDMVSYYGEYWTACSDFNSRFGCTGFNVFVKVRVKPVATANLDHKRVGVIYKTPYGNEEITALGYYHTTWANGDEEWHVPIPVPQWQNIMVFNAWYQDGAGHTYYDDNQGERHALTWGGTGTAVRVEEWLNTVAVTTTGVSGQINLRVADLDYDKIVGLVWSTDDWVTAHWIEMGSPTETNTLYWAEDLPWPPGFERWRVDLDVPGDFTRFSYAVVYQHGVVNDATTYEFWDNNFGHDYTVTRPVVE